MSDKLPIFHFTFPDRYQLAATFLRFQEHYESPRFRGKVFSWEDFMDWYAATRGNFTYTSDWSGFNVPSSVFAPFLAGDFDPLTRKERALLDRVRRIRGRFYIIGTSDGDDIGTKTHECVHGLFHVMPDYANDVVAALRRHDTRRLRGYLKEKGYADAVVHDEINAYLTTGLDRGMGGPEVPSMKRALRGVYRLHFGADIADTAERRRLIRRVHSEKFFPVRRRRT